MKAAPQGFEPLAVTDRVAPTATEAALALTAVTVPAAATPIPADKEVTRNAAIDLMGRDRSKGRAGPPPGGPGWAQACWVRVARDLASISCWVRKMLHQSLCSATGIPHSTQTRTRGLAAPGFFENSFWKIVICSQTEDRGRRFAEKRRFVNFSHRVT